MGCWNGTCGISQLPILAGEKIRVFILKPSSGTNKFVTNPNSFVYSTDMFDALGVPFVAEYDDYGSVENVVEDYNSKIIHAALKDMVVLPKNKPFSKGDDVQLNGKSHFEIVDIQDDMVSVKLSYDDETKIVPISDIRHDNGEDFYDDIGDLAHTIRLIERNVFEINNKIWAPFGYNKTAIPGLFYVRENIWQAMTADIEEENEYSFGAKSRKTWLKLIDDFINILKTMVDEMNGDDEEKRKISEFRMIMGIESLGNRDNPVGYMFRTHSDVFPAILYKEPLVEAIKNDDIDFAKQMLIDILDTTMVLGAMSHMRKPLIPQCGQGSQSTGEDYHEALNKVIATEIDSIKHHWDEEE